MLSDIFSLMVIAESKYLEILLILFEFNVNNFIKTDTNKDYYLKKSIGRATLSFDELRTLVVENESTLNNAPITYVYDDEEISYPLTPSCLIYGCRTPPNNSQYDMVSTNKSLTRRVKHHRKLLNEFGKQWRHEYRLSIGQSTRARNNEAAEKIAMGDTVILKNERS